MVGICRRPQVRVPDFINVETIFHRGSIRVTRVRWLLLPPSAPPATGSRASH
jgi:hypothetical protein